MNVIPASLAKRLETNPFRFPNRYVEWHGRRVLAETVCKRCGTILTALGPDPRVPPMDREVKGTKLRTIIRETFVSRMKTKAFDMIRFEVEEPAEVFVPEAEETQDAAEARLGAHRTSICTDCKNRLIDGTADIEEVQHLYDADLERMAIENEANGVPADVTRKTLARLAARKVTRVLG